MKYFVIECIKCKKICGCGTYKFSSDEKNLSRKLCGGPRCGASPINCELIKHADIHRKDPGFCGSCEKIIKERREDVVVMEK